MSVSRARLLLPVVLALGLLLSPAAHGNPTQASIMVDDTLLLHRGDVAAAHALTRMKSLGVDIVRVTVLWRAVAAGAQPTPAEIAALHGAAKRQAILQAKHFKATDPNTYPHRNWDPYDYLVQQAGELGLRVYFTVTGPGPASAMTAPPADQQALARSWKPDPLAFGKFVQAVGRRFDGTYRDEDARRAVLPRVGIWSLWNEPNRAAWLAPQWERIGDTVVPASPALYRELYWDGFDGLFASGHVNDVVLMGETAALGSNARTPAAPMRPGKFLRELACVGPTGVPYFGEGATLRSCEEFATRGLLRASGYAHHAYTPKTSPLTRYPSPDSFTMLNISDLGVLLDALSAQSRHMILSGLPLFITQFGFETNPPDPLNGISQADQATFDTIGEHQAWSNPRVYAQAQYLLNDAPPTATAAPGSTAYWAGPQSGLFRAGGRPKPAATAYKMPLLASKTDTLDPVTNAPVFDLWGQLRMLASGTKADATIQWRADGSKRWIAVGDPVPVDAMGYYEATRSAPQPVAGEWRSVLLGPAGEVVAASLASAG